LVSDIRRLDAQIADSRARIVHAVRASGTSVVEINGVGPIVAALLLGIQIVGRYFDGARGWSAPGAMRRRPERYPAERLYPAWSVANSS
jgi:hypothetical protein